jgi:peptidoglycan hydrolase-like protein with peptidoglycan-binding domain
VRRDLISRQQVSGTLGYQDYNRTVTNELPGIVTAAAPEGSIVYRGQALYRIDGMPVTLMYGDVPAYRPLAKGISDGPDVKQLQENLLALGFGKGSMVANGTFDWATGWAVKHWQASLGLKQSGEVMLGQIVFLPGAARIKAQRMSVGAPAGPGMPAVDTSSPTRIVTVQLDATMQAQVKVGDPVEVTLPDGSMTTGRVASVARVAQSNNGGGGGGSPSTTVAVTVRLDHPGETGSLDQAPVQVGITTQSVLGVLAVPVNALLAQTGGGYAVEVVRNGRRTLVPITVGLFDDSDYVQISGSGIAEGMRVVVPA